MRFLCIGKEETGDWVANWHSKLLRIDIAN